MADPDGSPPPPQQQQTLRARRLSRRSSGSRERRSVASGRQSSEAGESSASGTLNNGGGSVGSAGGGGGQNATSLGLNTALHSIDDDDDDDDPLVRDAPAADRAEPDRHRAAAAASTSPTAAGRDVFAHRAQKRRSGGAFLLPTGHLDAGSTIAAGGAGGGAAGTGSSRIPRSKSARGKQPSAAGQATTPDRSRPTSMIVGGGGVGLGIDSPSPARSDRSEDDAAGRDKTTSSSGPPATQRVAYRQSVVAPRVASLDADSTQIVSMALNLSESRRLAARRNAAVLPATQQQHGGPVATLPPRLAPLPLPDVAGSGVGSLRQHLQQQRRSSGRTISPRPDRVVSTGSQQPQRPSPGALQSSFMEATGAPGDAAAYRYHFTSSTLARAQKAKDHLELMAQYRRLLELLPPLKAAGRQQGWPGLQQGGAAAGISPPASPRLSQASTYSSGASAAYQQLGRGYNPLQYIRNRKVRARERQAIDGDGVGFGDLPRVTDWVDGVAKWTATGQLSSPDGPTLPPYTNVNGDDAASLISSAQSVSSNTNNKALARPRRPRVDWVTTPADLIADVYWLEQGDNRRLIEDRHLRRIFPKQDAVSSAAQYSGRPQPRLETGASLSVGGLETDDVDESQHHHDPADADHPQQQHRTRAKRARQRLHDLKPFQHHHRHSSSLQSRESSGLGAGGQHLRVGSLTDSSDNNTDSDGRKRRRSRTITSNSKDILEKQMLEMIAKEAREKELQGLFEKHQQQQRSRTGSYATPMTPERDVAGRHAAFKSPTREPSVAGSGGEQGPGANGGSSEKPSKATAADHVARPPSPRKRSAHVSRASLDIPSHARRHSNDFDSSLPNSPELRPVQGSARRGRGDGAATASEAAAAAAAVPGYVAAIGMDLSPPSSRPSSPSRNPFRKVKRKFRDRSRERDRDDDGPAPLSVPPQQQPQTTAADLQLVPTKASDLLGEPLVVTTRERRPSPDQPQQKGPATNSSSPAPPTVRVGRAATVVGNSGSSNELIGSGGGPMTSVVGAATAAAAAGHKSHRSLGSIRLRGDAVNNYYGGGATAADQYQQPPPPAVGLRGLFKGARLDTMIRGGVARVGEMLLGPGTGSRRDLAAAAAAADEAPSSSGTSTDESEVEGNGAAAIAVAPTPPQQQQQQRGRGRGRRKDQQATSGSQPRRARAEGSAQPQQQQQHHQHHHHPAATGKSYLDVMPSFVSTAAEHPERGGGQDVLHHVSTAPAGGNLDPSEPPLSRASSRRPPTRFELLKPPRIDVRSALDDPPLPPFVPKEGQPRDPNSDVASDSDSRRSDSYAGRLGLPEPAAAAAGNRLDRTASRSSSDRLQQPWRQSVSPGSRLDGGANHHHHHHHPTGPRLTRREMARIRTLLLSSGIKALEIARRANQPRTLSGGIPCIVAVGAEGTDVDEDAVGEGEYEGDDDDDEENAAKGKERAVGRVRRFSAGTNSIDPTNPTAAPAAALLLTTTTTAAGGGLAATPAADPALLARAVPSAQLYPLAARLLGASIQTSATQLQAALDAFASATLPRLLDAGEAARERVAGDMYAQVRGAADEVDVVGGDLAGGQRMKLRRVEDSIARLARRRRRRFRWVRRAGWLAVEWVLVGFMWYVWFVVMIARLAWGVGSGVVGGVRWLLWL